MILNYQMNAGYFPKEHWVHSEEGGGRNLGEACHIYDLFVYLTESVASKVEVHHINPVNDYYSSRDNFIATISFEDGSIASLTYTSIGAATHPKEIFHVFVDGQVMLLDDYNELWIADKKTKKSVLKGSDKGHLKQLREFGNSIRCKSEWPIPLWQQIESTRIAILVEEELNK
jgi:predicted dehydrogenase